MSTEVTKPVDAVRIPALSIRQPWAWAILHAGKRIENREWRACKYRGPIYIHASLWGGRGERLTVDAQDEGFAAIHCAQSAQHPCVEKPITLRMLYEHRGGIVGRANVVDVIADSRDITRWIDAALDDETRTARIVQGHAWWNRGFALVLDNVEPLPFVPCKGALGLFDVGDAVRAALRSEAA